MRLWDPQLGESKGIRRNSFGCSITLPPAPSLIAEILAPCGVTNTSLRQRSAVLNAMSDSGRDVPPTIATASQAYRDAMVYNWGETCLSPRRTRRRRRGVSGIPLEARRRGPHISVSGNSRFGLRGGRAHIFPSRELPDSGLEAGESTYFRLGKFPIRKRGAQTIWTFAASVALDRAT